MLYLLFDAYVVVTISWIILSCVVGAVADSIGRRFLNYFAISLFFSPIVGFIVLMIKGKVTKDEILDDNSHIFYCPNCKSAYGGHGGKEEYCPECHTLLYETTVLTEEWRQYSFTKKESLKKDFSDGQQLRSNQGLNKQVVVKQESRADELLKYKKLLDDGAITKEEYDVVKKKILGL